MDNQVKQRVIGAVVLVALAVIFVPMLLEKPDGELGPVGSNLPEQPEQGVQDRIEPLTLPEPPAEEEPAQRVIDPAPAGSATAVPPDAAAPAAPPAAAPAPAPGADAPVDAAPGGAAPAPAASAPAAADNPAPVEAAPAIPAPAPQSQPAPAAPAQPPAVTSARPAPAAQGDSASKPLSGWVVQLASLASKDNALALRERLRGLGHTAFVEEVKAAQGTLYRVRVGPELERANADNLRSRLEQQVQIKGIVTRYP